MPFDFKQGVNVSEIAGTGIEANANDLRLATQGKSMEFGTRQSRALPASGGGAHHTPFLPPGIDRPADRKTTLSQ